jgi:hypothetical protein
MCCQRIDPPFSGSKTCAPKRRSAPSANRAAASAGKMSSTRIEVTSTVQTKIGIRNIVMPGARMHRIVVMKLTAPRMVPNPARASPKTHRSPPRPGL